MDHKNYVPKVGDRIRFREEYVKIYREEVRPLALPVRQTGDPDGLVFCVREVKKSFSLKLTLQKEMATGKEKIYWSIYRDGTNVILRKSAMWHTIRVFEYVGVDATLPTSDSMYCSCGGLTKKVAAGIGPSAGSYDFCTVCKKERI